MKKLIIAALLFVGMTGFSQENGTMRKRDQMEKLTPEQRNQLQLKKMTLELNLSSSQQQEMSKMIAERNAKMDAMRSERKANKEKGIKPTADARFKTKNDILDYQIAENAKMKKLLNADQFTKWDKMRDRRKSKRHHEGKRKDRKNADSDNAPK